MKLCRMLDSVGLMAYKERRVIRRARGIDQVCFIARRFSRRRRERCLRLGAPFACGLPLVVVVVIAWPFPLAFPLDLALPFTLPFALPLALPLVCLSTLRWRVFIAGDDIVLVGRCSAAEVSTRAMAR